MSLTNCINLEGPGELFCCDFDVHTHRIIGTSPVRTRVGNDAAWRIFSSGGENVCIWDAIEGTLLNTLQGHTRDVRSVAFSTDGTMIASGSVDNTVRIWDVNAGTLLNTLQVSPENTGVASIAFSPDGTMIVTVSLVNTLQIWDINAGTLINTLQGRIGYLSVNSLAFSPDGTKIVTGSDDNRVRIFDVNAGTLLNTLQGHSSTVYSIAFSPDSTKIVSGSRDNTVRIWDVNAGTLLNTLQGHSSAVRSVAFSPDGITIVSGSDDNTVLIWETRSGRVLNRVNIESGPLIVKFSEDGDEFYVVERNKNVCTFPVLSESNITDIETLVRPMVETRKTVIRGETPSPNLKMVSDTMGEQNIRVNLLGYLHGNMPQQNKGFYKTFGKPFVEENLQDLSNSIPNPEENVDELPPNVGGKKTKKTRRYKKNKSKRRYKKK